MNKMGIFVREQAGKVRLVRQHYALTFCVARHSWITIEEFYKLKYCSTVVYMVPRA